MNCDASIKQAIYSENLDASSLDSCWIHDSADKERDLHLLVPYEEQEWPVHEQIAGVGGDLEGGIGVHPIFDRTQL